MKKLVLSISMFLIIITTGFAQVAENAEDVTPLKVGDKVPTIKLTSLENIQVSLEDIVKTKPTVLLFYRGGWCPYCNKHLAAVGQSKSEILELGYKIVGISPDSPTELKESISKNELSYDLYSDADGSLIKSMGIAYKAPEKYSNMLLKYSGDKNSGILPVPSLFVIGVDGKILYEYVNPDYKTRMSPEELIKQLKSLK
ncbi:AhpC/TSA family protein [Lutibacter sp. A64]|uniref:peroxiredoxin-like family protein n=1 Tax=Lutibacter sp. A64 TaxID=2918526 RepID=UPI001F0616FE|nr:peroxiredoxin-like family protein [Lutibacter sp. A64]UMB54382.1 AhpC/TSA family protein [Lutibacter sp. A64]